MYGVRLIYFIRRQEGQIYLTPEVPSGYASISFIYSNARINSCTLILNWFAYFCGLNILQVSAQAWQLFMFDLAGSQLSEAKMLRQYGKV